MRYIMIFPLAVMAACGPLANVDDADLTEPDTVVLAIDEPPTVYDRLEVRFTEVPEDSRCPTDVVCVWAGNAKVVLNTAVGGIERVVALNTTGDPEIGSRSITVDGYRITLLDLSPDPVSDEPIQPDAYRATLELAHE